MDLFYVDMNNTNKNISGKCVCVVFVYDFTRIFIYLQVFQIFTSELVFIDKKLIY